MNIRCAIVGPTSYTAQYLIEILLRHPDADIAYLATQREALPNIADEFPQFRARCELAGQPIDSVAIAAAADVAFLCLPHVASMRYAPKLLDAGVRVIDLSADYRLRDADQYARVYGHAHEDTANLALAVYGLPEFFAEQIKEADLVANPGCYPTAAALSIAPLLQRSLVKPTGIIINATSGVTGAGRSPKQPYHFPEANEAFSPYAPGTHRHQTEIEQTLRTIKGSAVNALFVPHLLPVDRGILESIYLDPADDDVTEAELYEAFHDAYAQAPFVRVRRELPNIKWVRDSNYCDIAVRLVCAGGEPGAENDGIARKVIVFAAEDNMIKGASGQAVQNMNLMFGLEQTAGLK